MREESKDALVTPKQAPEFERIINELDRLASDREHFVGGIYNKINQIQSIQELEKPRSEEKKVQEPIETITAVLWRSLDLIRRDNDRLGEIFNTLQKIV